MKLTISDNLQLPLNAVTQKLAMLGRTGSGKTYGATKLAEEMLAAGAQIVALDPVGTWFGLRLAADGRGAGISIPVFGGLHGDVPLESTSGALVADLVVDRGISIICDVSQFEHDTEKARFARDFASRFFFRKKSSPSAVHVFLEECQEFIPERQQRGEEHMLHAFQRMWKLGRNFGIGGSLISQRPQDVNKKALNLTECVFAFQLTGPHERRAIEGWIHEKGLDEDISALLPKLQVGEARVWSPAWLNISQTVRIATKRTFNASSTPEVGGRSQARELAPIDLENIRAAMADTIERAEADDPKKLRKRIADLERAAKAEVAFNPLAEQTARREAARAVHETYQPALQSLNAEVGKLRGSLEEIERALRGVVSAQDFQEALTSQPPMPVKPADVAEFGRRFEQAARLDRRSQPAKSNGGPTVQLPAGEKAVLTVCAQYPSGATREQISILTGYKRSTRDAYIQRLRERLFVDNSGDSLIATTAGFRNLGDGFEPLPTGVALQRYWLSRLPAGEARILAILIEARGRAVSREKLGDPLGFARSSRDAYVQRLAARKLVEPGRGEVKASGVLFE